MSDVNATKFDFKVNIEKPWLNFTGEQLWNAFKEGEMRNLQLVDDVENLKMVCRRLSAAKSISVRDKIAAQYQYLFKRKITRRKPITTAPKSRGESKGEG